MTSDPSPSAPEDGVSVFFALRELADALGVTPSGISHAVREGHSVRSLYPVSMWAVRGNDGRVTGFDVPAEAADVIHASAMSRRAIDERSAADVEVPMRPPVSPVVPVSLPFTRLDSDYDRQREHYERVLSQRDADVERHQATVERLREDLERIRSSRAEDLERLRTQLAQERERHAEERQDLRDEIASLKSDLRAYEAGHTPESQEEGLYKLVEEYAPVLMPAILGYFQRSDPAPSLAEASTPAIPASTPPLPPSLDQQRAARLLTAMQAQDTPRFLEVLRELRGTLTTPEALAVGKVVLANLRHVSAAIVGSWVQAAMEVIPELERFDAATAATLASSFGVVSSLQEAEWLLAVLVAAGLPEAAPDDESEEETEAVAPKTGKKGGRLTRTANDDTDA